MIKAVVFDCFGVLYNDAYKEFFASYHAKMGKREGYYRSLAYKVDAGLIDDEFFYAELSAISGVPAAEIRRRMRDTSGLNHALVDIVRHLKSQYKIGMLSNAESQFLHEFLAKGGITHLFDVVIASSDTGTVKPDPTIYRLACKKLGVQPEEVVFIDDGEHNVVAAREIGMQAFLYTSASQLDADVRTVLTY